MGVISAVLTASLVGLVVLLPLALMRAKRAPKGRRALRPEPRAGRRIATAPAARAARYAPKRRAPQPSLAARVAIPTTAAAGTGAAIVLVTASATGAPSSAKAEDSPVRITVTAHETVSAYPSLGPTATALRITPRQLQQGKAGTQAAGSAVTSQAGSTAAPTGAPTAAPTAGSTGAPAASSPSDEPTARPTPAPTEPQPTPEPTPEPEPDEPGLVEGVVGGIGGLVGGIVGPILGG